MQTIKTKLPDLLSEYPIENLSAPERVVFIDIETTGFSPKTSNIYLIGCLSLEDNVWTATQFFAENYSDEKDLIEEFFSFAENYDYLIHFNGNNFDLPFIEDKCKEHGLVYSFEKFDGVDLYKRVSPYKKFLNLENCKQKTIEKFLKINREDIYSGGDLVGVFHSYVKTLDEEEKKLLLLHNFEDLKGMFETLPILAICDLFNSKLRVTKVSANYYNDAEGTEHSELFMYIDLPVSFKVPFSSMFEQCYFAASKTEAMLRVPIYNGELKYFYANYKDYYYLPDEDVALHKSVASFVDKNHRIPAKAANCYTKKEGCYLPQWDALATPFFKKDYNSKRLFFELTNERRTDRELFSEYASHILAHMAI